MRRTPDGLRLSATDLASFLCCRHSVALEMAVAAGARKRPSFRDPVLEALARRGLEHERRHVDDLRAGGLDCVDLREVTAPDDAAQRTLAAMRAGAPAIVQAALRQGNWFGRPDVLRRVELPSRLGPWSYEAADTKLAMETRAGTVLQLGLYSEMLGAAQGTVPVWFHVVTPDPEQPTHTYRTADYAAYLRWIRAQMEAVAAQDHDLVAAANYPEPVERCQTCPWSGACDERRHADDHLSLVAGITALQRSELERHDVTTLTALAGLPEPLPFHPRRGSAPTLLRVREQARVQLESRGRPVPVCELRPFEEGKGLARLPEPSPGDVFLDLEGDPLAREGGREYLFGVVTLDPSGSPVYRGFWALDDGEERAAFESAMDLFTSAWDTDPGLHVYHYAPYEPSALKRLMGRHATREDALDRLLRAGRFVDLYGVVRQGLHAGVERYSIKNLEVLYGFRRAVPLPEANRALRHMELALEMGAAREVPPEVREAVEGYNRDDCVSTLHLRNWLEERRAQLVAGGTRVPRPVLVEGEPSAKLDERATKVARLRRRLLAGIPEDPEARSAEQRARSLLAHLLDWHRREDKASWWEYFRLRDLPAEDLFDEPQAVTGMERVRRVEIVTRKTGTPTGSVVDRYRFPPQEMEIRAGDELRLPEGVTWGEVVEVDRQRWTLDVRKGPAQAEAHPAAAFAFSQVDTSVLEQAIGRFAEGVARAGPLGAGRGRPSPAGAHLLLALRPRLRKGRFEAEPGESTLDFAVRAVRRLDRSSLAIQGPPGSGKTYTAARMICALVADGRKVGVTATSHKVVQHLLEAVADAAAGAGVPVRLGHKTDATDGPARDSRITVLRDNARAASAIGAGTVNVLGGTAWLWARPELADSVEVLFVDEAGQMSLANAVAVAGAARSLVLLGDPQQLDQPLRGNHPDGVEVSALEHVLGDHQTIPAKSGIFLATTWRLAPAICSFTSELFYESRLLPRAGLERQALVGAGDLGGSGLRVVEVEHAGNRTSSAEEVHAVAALVERLLEPGARWVDEGGASAPMRPEDILVVSPYNAQVSRLIDRLGQMRVRVGTVDKFQGQEAPVVIYSTATSRPEDAPRGMEFLYSLNRLNVATSRARCLAILVTSPRLFEPDCRTPRQMHLANALCRFRELAGRVRLPVPASRPTARGAPPGCGAAARPSRPSTVDPA